MPRENADAYIELGERIHDARLIYELDENFEADPSTGRRRLNLKGEEEVRNELRRLIHLAQRLKLPMSEALLDRRLGYPDSTPQTGQEFNIIFDHFKDEIRTRLFLFVPSHVAQYYEWQEIVSDKVLRAFPKATEELRAAGTAHATGLNTATVFHAMRAAEMAVRALGTSMEIELTQPIELANQQEILTAVQSKISQIGRRPRSIERDADLEFFGRAAAQLQFFKDGWRIRLAHGRASYTESQAREIIDHVRAFFEIVADRLNE